MFGVQGLWRGHGLRGHVEVVQSGQLVPHEQETNLCYVLVVYLVTVVASRDMGVKEIFTFGNTLCSTFS